MSGDSDRTRTPSQRPAVRIEYLDSRSQDDYREYRLAIYLPEGPTDVRVRIPSAAFAESRVLLQDGPDVCYRHLLRMLAAGEAVGPDVITIDGAELAAFRAAHTPAPRRPAPPRPAPPKRTWVTRSPAPGKDPRLPAAAEPPPGVPEQVFDEGQRVSHEVFGAGVTMPSSEGRTSVQFDEHGVKTFVTSMVKLERLSAPHEWEAGSRGKNRPRDADRQERAPRKRRG